jgi:uncharacterized protein YrrD
MLRAKDLDGRAVIELETARKIGYVDEILLEPSGDRIAAFQVSEGSSLLGGGRRTLVRPESVESIGPEAIMVRSAADDEGASGPSESLPRLSHVVGRKVVTQSGKLLGAISTVLLEGTDGRILGYELKDANWSGGLSELFTGEQHEPGFVRADGPLRLSDELLVVPDDALVRGEMDTERATTATVAGRRSVASEEMSPRPVMAAAPLSATYRQWDDVRPRFRSQWEQTHGTRGGLWEEHEPGYRFGWEMRNDARYRDRPWSEVEPEIQREWESRESGRAWSQSRTAIQGGWDNPADETTGVTSTTPPYDDARTRESVDRARPLL